MMIERSGLEDEIKNGLKSNPGVVLLGPRQCGKTTLARKVASAVGAKFFDLEHPDDAAALENPMLAMESLRGLVVIDEVQRQPNLFPVLRVLMDRPTQPARFLLLGSASPHVVRGVTESLAGRVSFIDMQGFSLQEAGVNRQGELWERGGFPRSFLADGDASSYAWRANFIRTFVEKDMPSLGLGATPSSMGKLWRMSAHYHGQTLNASELGRSLGESYKTVQRHLEMLEGAFMIRMLKPWFENLGKRLVRSPKLYLRDSGIFHALMGINDRDALMSHPKLGASWEGYAMEQILGAMPRTEAWFWGTQSGAELDLFVMPGGRRVGFEFKVADAPRMTRSLGIAFEDLNLDQLIVVKPRGEGYALTPKIRVLALQGAVELAVGLC